MMWGSMCWLHLPLTSAICMWYVANFSHESRHIPWPQVIVRKMICQLFCWRHKWRGIIQLEIIYQHLSFVIYSSSENIIHVMSLYFVWQSAVWHNGKGATLRQKAWAKPLVGIRMSTFVDFHNRLSSLKSVTLAFQRDSWCSGEGRTVDWTFSVLSVCVSQLM